MRIERGLVVPATRFKHQHKAISSPLIHLVPLSRIAFLIHNVERAKVMSQMAPYCILFRTAPNPRTWPTATVAASVAEESQTQVRHGYPPKQ
ncbi:predicted protein [Plenodomus lingam JN3]|uniref:Predicted protein n=1 Tax=Leptosphaeria maculans (strain JN3 / isolate v23.1.3 / race Av1-4-5-6-7-8) TaxID=985895 RepID=E4ZM56_LEPMJ|nr:predicted protein [Plenodomus lingam JN3]CBX92405.1 predicted protein [Plenodomus lingam JN3]